MLITLFVFAKPVFAGPMRAQWLNSRQLLVKLSQGLRVADNMSFVLANSEVSFKNNPLNFSLPVIEAHDNYALLSTANIKPSDINELIRRPLKVYTINSNQQLLDATAIQYAGLLDDLYFYDGKDLGVSLQGSQWQLKLWAPTAMSVRVFLYRSGNSQNTSPEQIYNMTTDHGVWSATLPSQYQNYFYLYEVTVYQPATDKLETSLVTDPYSFSLAINGSKSQIVDVNSGDLKPSGWDFLRKPALNSFKDIVIYELHIRDFSAGDQTVPFMYRGSYMAFTQANSDGMTQLRSLSEAGLTHVHLMPFNDFGSVDEDKNTWETVNFPSTNLQDVQGALGQIRSQDAFNWGYDPVHFLAPDGSYAVDPQGSSRIKEVRSMVQALNQTGLRVVQDVVFNHTYKNGLLPQSVFDKIVPSYYYRLDDEGNVQTSSCCNDTASEHRMMEKLMIDSVLYWARTYKIDSFRFDLMSFHTRQTMLKIKDAVRSLTEQNDGIDGSKIYIYGEGWSFGSLFSQDPGSAMTAANSFGAGIGLFNDRLRDAVRGGTTNSTEKSDQGFATGLYFDFNKEPANRNTPPDVDGQRDKLLHLGDVIKVGLAGNLRDFTFREHLGSVIHGGDLYFRSSSVGTSATPIETINYVSAHDGYSLWDAVQAKAPFFTSGRTPTLTTSEDRQRMVQLALAIPMLSQGIPFVEAGTELLRSKNGDQDSYDSGDFFNRIDWSKQNNHWGEALPPAWKNLEDWSFWQPRLVVPEMKVSAAMIQQTDRYFKALIRLRQSSSLFKMNSLDEIMAKLVFIDDEVTPQPGLIAMALHQGNEALLIMFNSSREPRLFSNKVLGYSWQLHPLLDAKVDPALAQVVLMPAQSAIQIPGRSTVVLKLVSATTKSKGAR